MSRQIQIRRGMADENDEFTGAIGEITMDTTTMLCVFMMVRRWVE